MRNVWNLSLHLALCHASIEVTINVAREPIETEGNRDAGNSRNRESYVIAKMAFLECEKSG